MKKAKYRITNVRIEGFRGFTKPQTVELAEQNVFVFGPNGCGKSSIIEAIRWCLFGSPAGKDIEVRNTFYEKGECTVILILRVSQALLVSQGYKTRRISVLEESLKAWTIASWTCSDSCRTCLHDL